MRNRLLTVALSVGFLHALLGCSTARVEMREGSSSAQNLPQLTKYYQAATSPRHRAVRKPVRDSRARAMRMLAGRAEELASESEQLANGARLATDEESQGSAASELLQSYQSALTDLNSAARGGGISAVRTQYARVRASHQRLTDAGNPTK